MTTPDDSVAAGGTPVRVPPIVRSSGPATPDAPEREWACNRCMYSWDGNDGWCPICGATATHGRAFAPKSANTRLGHQ